MEELTPTVSEHEPVWALAARAASFADRQSDDERRSVALHPSVLVVDDDLGTRETFEAILRRTGFDVATAASGAEALDKIQSTRFDVIVLDLLLPDLFGSELLRTVRRVTPVPVVVVSGFLTINAAVEAMKLGAMDVIEKPVDMDDLLAAVESAMRTQDRAPHSDAAELANRHSNETHPAHLSGPGSAPHSAADRWVKYVLRGCDSDNDFRTLEEWATLAAVSCSSLCECCRLLHIRPQHARDLARLLRAILKSRAEGSDATLLLDVADRRTLKHMLERGGLKTVSRADRLYVDDFLEKQQFVPPANIGVRLLREKLRNL